MQRSPLLQIMIYCPHLAKTVAASLNQVTERLVDCSTKSSCRAADATANYPHACPVFPSLTTS